MSTPARREDPVDAEAEELYGIPLSRFTAERKRMAEALRARGERALATRVAALARPTLPAWVVNQLWRTSKSDFEALFAAGQRMRGGEAAAWQEQRTLLARLGAAAADILRGDRHVASPATLRRVTANLLSLSAQGSFAPDAPGRLVADRDPPGFEVLGDLDVAAAPAPTPAKKGGTATARARISSQVVAREEKERARSDAKAAVERARAAARDKAERERMAEKARSRAAALEKTIDRLRAEIEETEEKLASRREALRDAERERDSALREADAGSKRRSRG